MKFKISSNSLEPVPLSERRSVLTMGLLWLTMVTSFPAVLAGFEWYRQGISFGQLIICAILSLVLLLLYSVPACELGARTGLGYCALGKIVFGQKGSLLLTGNLLWLFTAWYGLTAVLMAQALIGLFHWHISLILLSILCALIMSFNNFFGFTGVANFARFMAGPVLTIWVISIFFKAINHPLITIAPQPPQPSSIYALSIISSFVIGFAVWGNEQDYWRYSKPGAWRSAIPLAVSIIIGQIIFPAAGWLIARTSGITDYAAIPAFMSSYCFSGITIIGLLIITADYFSTNDSSLFGCAAAVESVYRLQHNLSVAIFAIAGAIVAALLALTNMSESLSAMVSLNCVLLPIPTIIMLAEWYLREKVFHTSAKFSAESELPKSISTHWPAIIAFCCGLIVGVITSGLIPVFEFCHVGIPSIQAWLTSIVVYIPLRMYEYNF